ncbi:MAG: hypothetical protein D6778_05940, partial [Nitrospirae bacterium]
GTGQDCLNLAKGEADISAYAVVLGADYTMGATKLTLEAGMGSGDDDPADDEIGIFITSLGAHPNAPINSFIYDYSICSASGLVDNQGKCLKNTGIANTTYVKLAAAHKVSKDLKVKGQFIWLQATEDVAIDGTQADSDLGMELDAKVAYNLTRNVQYYVEGGYFMAGDAYRDGDADDAWRLRHGIQMKF